MHRASSSTAAMGRQATRRSYRLSHAWCLGVTVVIAAVIGVASAQSRPGWVLAGDAREAYVEAYSFPVGIAQVDTGIFVICDDNAPSGLNVIVWTGRFGGSVPEQVDGLVRREQDEPRRHPFLVFGSGSDRAAPLFFDDVDRFLDDIRRGGSLALRLLLLPGVAEASQPTYMYDVSGFAAIESQLACLAVAADPFGAAAANDPFAAPAAPDPFAAPSTPVAPSAPPPSTPPAPPAPSTPSTPSATQAERGIDWVYLAEDTMVLTGNSSYGFAVACLDDLPVVFISDVVGGTLPRDEFRVRFSFDVDTVYRFVELEPNFYAALTDDLDGLDGLFIAVGIMVSFEEDVVATLVSGGAPRELVRTGGGLGFMLEYDQLPCAAQ